MLSVYRKSGWKEIRPFFNEFDNFYHFLKKNGIVDEVRLDWVDNDQVNHFLFLCFKDDPRRTMDLIVDDILTDVKKKDGYYLQLSGLEEIAAFFKEGDRSWEYDLREVIVDMIDNKGQWEPYTHDTTDDIYRDVIEVLTPENREFLKEVFLGSLDGYKIDDIGTEEMMMLAIEQGHDEYLYVTPDNIDRIFDDQETMVFLLESVADDINSTLYNVHQNSFNESYSKTVWDLVIRALSPYFDSEIYSESVKVSYGNGHDTKYSLKIKKLPEIIQDYLEQCELPNH